MGAPVHVLVNFLLSQVAVGLKQGMMALKDTVSHGCVLLCQYSHVIGRGGAGGDGQVPRLGNRWAALQTVLHYFHQGTPPLLATGLNENDCCYTLSLAKEDILN